MTGCESESSGSLAAQLKACVQTCRTRSRAVQAGCWEEAEACGRQGACYQVDAMNRPLQFMATENLQVQHPFPSFFGCC